MILKVDKRAFLIVPSISNITAPFSLLVCFLLVTGCKLEVVAPEGGFVTTDSGSYRCAEGQRCEINVVDIFFDETFIAQPDYRHEFYHWRKAAKHFCWEVTGSCSLSSGVFEGISALESFLRLEEKFYLRPVFLEKGNFEFTSSGECFNPLLYEKGTKITLETTTTVIGFIRYNVIEEISRLVNGASSFEGRPAIKTSTEVRATTMIYIPSKDPSFAEQTDHIIGESYSVVDFDALKVTKIASLARSKTTQGDIPVVFSGKSSRKETFEPGKEMHFQMAAGKSFYSKSTGHVNGDSLSKSGDNYESYEYDEYIDDEVVYRGIESIRVPAGTFPACRFEKHSARNPQESEVISTRPGKIIEWYGVGNGLLIKSKSVSPDVSVSTSLVKGAINGTMVMPPQN